MWQLTGETTTNYWLTTLPTVEIWAHNNSIHGLTWGLRFLWDAGSLLGWPGF